jgi:hypothetical protein
MLFTASWVPLQLGEQKRRPSRSQDLGQKGSLRLVILERVCPIRCVLYVSIAVFLD